MGWLPIDGVWPIYAAIALTGMVRAFLSPIYNALFARVLARDQFARGAGLGAVVFQAGMIAGPALGGVLVGFGGKGCPTRWLRPLRWWRWPAWPR